MGLYWRARVWQAMARGGDGYMAALFDLGKRLFVLMLAFYGWFWWVPAVARDSGCLAKLGRGGCFCASG